MQGQVTLGRIVVHDRVKVESDILPRYFNHSSFASLRRQLNYFSFTRIGKGRQRGATYCNEAVVELEDILRLKRRSSVGGGSSGSNRDSSPSTSSLPSVATDALGKHATAQPKRDFVTLGATKPSARHQQVTPKLSAAPTAIVSPRSSPVHASGGEGDQHITLDLTAPPKPASGHPLCAPAGWNSLCSRSSNLGSIANGDEDILAGCRALLSFSRGFSQRPTTV